MRLTIANSKIKGTTVLINNVTHQRETLTEWPIWLPLSLLKNRIKPIWNNFRSNYFGPRFEYRIVPSKIVFAPFKSYFLTYWQIPEISPDSSKVPPRIWKILPSQNKVGLYLRQYGSNFKDLRVTNVVTCMYNECHKYLQPIIFTI